VCLVKGESNVAKGSFRGRFMGKCLTVQVGQGKVRCCQVLVNKIVFIDED
jgi:hypothetical protein